MYNNEEIETYIFYCYHCVYLDDDIDKNFYSRQKFIANIYPKTRQKYDNQDGIYKLANLCLWDDDEDIDLEDDEIIEDASDDAYVCFDENGKEISAKEYLETNNINLNFIGEGSTEFGQWHQEGTHYEN